MWYFCRVPWVHFLFREETIMKVRAQYRSDGARRFEEVAGGLNRMTVARAEELLRHSGFHLESLEAIPIRGWTWLVRNRKLREFFTSVVRCTARKPPT